DQLLPHAMLATRNTEEVASIVQLWNTEQIPIVPRGSGTNLCEGTTPSEGGIVLTFKQMNQIPEIDEENLTMTVETGVYTKEVFKAAEKVGLFERPDPGSMPISQIGVHSL